MKSVVEYQDANGKTYRVTMSVGTSWIRYPGNPRVPILYESGRPEQSVIHSFDGLWFGPFICLALGVMFIAISLYRHIAIGRNRSGAELLAGQKGMGDWGS